MDAFDADVLIYGAQADHPLGRRVQGELPPRSLPDARPVGVGSVLLLPEVLSKPWREGARDEVARLVEILGRLLLLPVDQATADLAAAMGARRRLRAADAVHLASAVQAGADRVITDNRRDVPATIAEIGIVYPADLPEPPAP